MASDMSVAAPTYRAADMYLPLSTVEASSHTVSDLLGDFSYNQSQIHADIRALWQILRDEVRCAVLHVASFCAAPRLLSYRVSIFPVVIIAHIPNKKKKKGKVACFLGSCAFPDA